MNLLMEAAGSVVVKYLANAVPAILSLMLSTSSGSIDVAQTFDNGSIGPGTKLVWGASKPWPGIVSLKYVSYLIAEPPYAAWIQANHPDWVEYKCDRKTPAWEFGDTGNIPIDFANPKVQRWIVETFVAPAYRAGYSGVAFDNWFLYQTWSYRCGHFSLGGEWVQQYRVQTINPNFVADVLAFARFLRDSVHGFSPGFRFALNYIFAEPFHFSIATQLALVGNADIWLDEGGFSTHYSGRAAGLARMQTLLAFSGCYISNNPLDTANRAAREWALANYLLVKGRCTYLQMSKSQEYSVPLDFPEYHVITGAPRGPAYISAPGVWTRDFDKLSVTVDLNHHTYRLAWSNR